VRVACRARPPNVTPLCNEMVQEAVLVEQDSDGVCYNGARAVVDWVESSPRSLRDRALLTLRKGPYP
jgi:hypothetical protein